MDKLIKVLNVKLSFIEAITQLKNDNDVIACICNNTSRPCIIMLNQLNELRIIENNIFDKLDTIFIDRLLHLDNVLENDWFLVIKNNL